MKFSKMGVVFSKNFCTFLSGFFFFFSINPYIIIGSAELASLLFIFENLKTNNMLPLSKYSKLLLLKALFANVLIADINAPLRSFFSHKSF